MVRVLLHISLFRVDIMSKLINTNTTVNNAKLNECLDVNITINNMRIHVDFVHHRSDQVSGLFYQLLQKAARKHLKINVEPSVKLL